MTNFSFHPYLECQDCHSLEDVIKVHSDEIVEWASSDYQNKNNQKMPIRQLVSTKGDLLTQLDYTQQTNRTFIVLLYDVCCEILLSNPAAILYNIIAKEQLQVGKRIETAMMILRTYGSNSDYIEAFDSICEKLSYAIENEEDNEWPCIKVFLRYYAKVVRDTSDEYIISIHNKINQSSKQYPFLTNKIITHALEIHTDSKEHAYNELNSIILNTPYASKIYEESDTATLLTKEYADGLASCSKQFSEIRSLAYNLLTKHIQDRDSVYRTLGRGVQILTTREQLLVYMHAYGLMHEAKLQSAFEHFPFSDIGININVVDWGCGQGIATMVLSEYIQKHLPSIHIQNVLLIEPSSIALETAKMHVTHFTDTTCIYTIEKEFDSIVANDIPTSADDVPFIHLFSNVLDYEGFNLTHLENLISKVYTGINYAVCVSPQINEIKTARLGAFEQHFTKNTQYHHYYDIRNAANTWQKSWSRVIRIFSF